MNWFERLTGFTEKTYSYTQSQFELQNSRLCSRTNGHCYEIGTLETPSLGELRAATEARVEGGRLRTSIQMGEIRNLHCLDENNGALFQVASQFNILEMVGPDITPEHGVTRYEYDATQGPACAIAAGAATIYRNYFAPVGQQIGQTADTQINTIGDLGDALANQLGVSIDSLWTMRNGYALAHKRGLELANEWMSSASDDEVDGIRKLLRIGVHSNVQVTEKAASPGQLVSQAFCSAMPVSYSRVQSELWQPLAKLVLDAAYEATLHAAVLNMEHGHSNRVLLTRLGGGAFGNSDAWIDDAIRRALRLFTCANLDVIFVSFGTPSAAICELAAIYESSEVTKL